jgi:acyl-CoA thioesterase I
MVAPTTHGLAYKKEFDAIFPALAKTYNLPLIPFLLEGVAMQPQYNQADGIHPNVAGAKLVSSILTKKILQVINTKK